MFFKKRDEKNKTEQAAVSERDLSGTPSGLESKSQPENAAFVASAQPTLGDNGDGVQASKNNPDAPFVAYGKILNILGQQPIFAGMPLGQVSSLIAPAIDSKQYVIANSQMKDNSGLNVPAAFIIWAKVSEEVDRRLSAENHEQTPLTPAEWTSGDIPWLILCVGPQQMLSGMIKFATETHIQNQSFKMRFTDKDGQQKVGYVSLSVAT